MFPWSDVARAPLDNAMVRCADGNAAAESRTVESRRGGLCARGFHDEPSAGYMAYEQSRRNSSGRGRRGGYAHALAAGDQTFQVHANTDHSEAHEWASEQSVMNEYDRQQSAVGTYQNDGFNGFYGAPADMTHYGNRFLANQIGGSNRGDRRRRGDRRGRGGRGGGQTGRADAVHAEQVVRMDYSLDGSRRQTGIDQPSDNNSIIFLTEIIEAQLEYQTQYAHSGVNQNQLLSSSAVDECKICLEQGVNSVLIPCGHLALCYECAKECKKPPGICPICRSDIEGVYKTFKA